MGFLNNLFGKRQDKVQQEITTGKQQTNGIDQNTQFLQAAKEGNTQQLRELIQKGVDLNTKDKEQGWTPLMRAIEEDHTEAAKFLIESKADVNIRAETGMTALMVAAVKGNIQVARFLLDAGADTTTKEMHGQTALDLLNLKLRALGQHANKELIVVKDMLTPIQVPSPQAQITRTAEQEREYQNLLIDREIAMMNARNVRAGSERAMSRLKEIENRLTELGWDGQERTRHP